MILTETEAKTKDCFRAATFAGSQQIADGPGPHCRASSCMAWRWAQKRNPDWVSGYTLMSGVQHPDDTKPAYVTDHERGYCGAAGVAR